MSASGEWRTLRVSAALAERLRERFGYSAAQRWALEAAIERAVEVESARIQAAWEERMRKQGKRMGWRW